jgi:hypothetical protein
MLCECDLDTVFSLVPWLLVLVIKVAVVYAIHVAEQLFIKTFFESNVYFDEPAGTESCEEIYEKRTPACILIKSGAILYLFDF